MKNQATPTVEVTAKKVKVVRTPEEIKAARVAASRKTLEKRKAKGIAAKQFFIHKSLFKEAEEAMKPILEKSKALITEDNPEDNPSKI